MKLEVENWIVRGGIIMFWWLFWVASLVGKFIAPGNLWFSEPVIEKLQEYLAPIGLSNLANTALFVIGLLEIAAIILLTVAMFSYVMGWIQETHRSIFYATVCALVIFSFFIVGDQLAGQQLLSQHTLYWIAVIMSWYVFTHSEKLLEMYIGQS